MTLAVADTPPSHNLAHHPVHRYIPLMKTKAGEVAALSNLTPGARARILPLFHACEQVKPSFVPGLAAAWAGRLAAVDGSFNYGHTGVATSFTALIIAMRNAGIPTLPCWGTSDPWPYQQAARALVDGNGAVVKVTLAAASTAAAAVVQLGLSPSSVDLVIDLKHIGSIDVASFGGYVANWLTQNASTLVTFRSVTLAAAAAPKDHGSLARGVNRVPRKDWLLWNAVRPHIPFQMDYGDYLTGHPDLTEPPGAAMAKATVSARYTLDTDWLIIKGRSTGGQHGLPMRQQYRSHAGLIANDPGFVGVPGVWADGQINLAALGTQGTASRGKWSGFAANRHLSWVAGRLP